MLWTLIKRKLLRLEWYIRLLKTVNVPPGYQKAVRTRMCEKLEHSLLLFTPQLERPYDLILSYGAIEGKNGSSATVVIAGACSPIQGDFLSTIVPVEEVTPRDGEEVCGTGVACGGLEPGTQQPGAKSAEGVVLKMEAEPVATSEHKETPPDGPLINRKEDNADDEMCRMVEEMLDQKPSSSPWSSPIVLVRRRTEE